MQRRFGKAGGNVAYHAYQSFKTGEVTAEECHRIGVETARRLWGNDRQVLVATHFNTGTYHNHFVANPVNMWTGKKLEAKYEAYYKLRDMSDRICKEHGLSVVKNPQRHKTARSVYFAEKNGEPTRYNLMRRALDEALTISSSWTELSVVLRKKGYVFVCDLYRRYAIIRSLSAKKCMRTFRLGAEYDKEALQDRLLENQRDIRVTQRYFEFMRPYTREYARKNPPTEEYYRQRDFYLHLPRVTGYLSFFRCVAIVLGVAPLYEKEYRQPLSAECREACRKLDRFTAEITLVCREHILPSEKAFAYKMKMDAMKRKAGRLEKNSSQLATNFDTATEIGKCAGESRDQVFRYIRLTHLIPDILKLVDEGKIALTPAVELSYLQPSEQEMLFSVMDSDEVTPSLSQARRLRRMSEAQTLTDDAVLQLLSEVKGNQVEYVKVPVDKLRSFFRPDTSVKQMTETLVKAMDFYWRGSAETGTPGERRLAMTKMEIQTLYEVMFTDYPDIVNVAQVQAMLGISRHLAYALIGDGDIPGMKIGNAYRVPKINVIRYALSAGNPQPAA